MLPIEPLPAYKPAPVPPGPRKGEKVYVTATAYTPWDAGCSGISAVRNRMRRYHIPRGWGIVAVDPRFIPLGSRIYVAGYGYAVACDTGGAVRGHRIDVCYWGADLYASTSSAVDHDYRIHRLARAASHHWGVRNRVAVSLISKP